MCKIYNTVGSLTTLKSELNRQNIHDFKSLKEVRVFQEFYPNHIRKLISHHEDLIEQEKEILNVDLANLKTAIDIRKQETSQILTIEINNLKAELEISKSNASKNIFKTIRRALKNWDYIKKIKLKEYNFEQEVEMSISNLVQDYRIKNNRRQFINSNFNEAVKRSASTALQELERKKKVIDGLNNYIYGAIGEQKVVKTLESLNDDYFLINDFDVSFSEAIYNRQENDYIKSVQIDHILIGPSGIFLIETKNWSEKSMENLNLRSPVEQIKRTSFALFYLLNSDRSSYQLHLDNHHWGDKKISIKNVIVLTTTKPRGEFQHVKILTLNELLSYVRYFKPVYSSSETNRIVEMILRINELKI